MHWRVSAMLGGGVSCCWWLGLVQLCLSHLTFMFPTRGYQVKNSIAARACALCQLTPPALIFMSLRCGDGVPSSAALDQVVFASMVPRQ